MKVNVYTREDKVKGVELQLEVSEYFIIQKALRNFTANMDEPMPDCIMAVMMTEDMNQKEQVELDEFNQEKPMDDNEIPILICVLIIVLIALEYLPTFFQ